MIATAGTQYEYNATGERVSKDNSSGVPQTLYLHDGDGNQIAELNAALTVQHVNVYSGKHLVGTWNPASGKVYYAYSDWLGTKRYEADGGGTYVNSWASLPFGDNQTALGTGPDATEHHFTGQEHDAESGLDHFAARYYQSQTARWLLPDWSATPVPVPYATFTNPQSLNLYTYVGNNPVNAVDADGHLPGGGGSTFTAQVGSALWECVHAGVNGDTDGCDFGAWGVDDGAAPNGAQESYQAYLGEVAQSEVDAQNSNAPAQQQSGSSKGTSLWSRVKQGFSNLAHFHSWGYVKTTVTTTEKYTLPAMAGIGAPRMSPQFNAGQGAVNQPGPPTPAPDPIPSGPVKVPPVEETPMQQLVKILGDALSNAADMGETFTTPIIVIKTPAMDPNNPMYHGGGCPTPDCSI